MSSARNMLRNLLLDVLAIATLVILFLTLWIH